MQLGGNMREGESHFGGGKHGKKRKRPFILDSPVVLSNSTFDELKKAVCQGDARVLKTRIRDEKLDISCAERAQQVHHQPHPKADHQGDQRVEQAGQSCAVNVQRKQAEGERSVELVRDPPSAQVGDAGDA